MNEFKELKEILKENLEYIEYYNKEILEYIEYFEIENFLSLIVRMVSLMNDEELIDQICKSKYQTLKEQAVINGTNAIHWKLIDDKDTWIRVAVAEYGNDEMRWKLIDDETWRVRLAVAKYGSKEMCEILKNDKDEDVRRVAENRLEELEKEKRKDERNKESEE